MDTVAIKTILISKDIHLGNVLCELYAESNESVIHIFFDCKITKQVWEMCDRCIITNQVPISNTFILCNLMENKTEVKKECGWPLSRKSGSIEAGLFLSKGK